MNGAQQSVRRSLFARRRFRAFPLMRWEARMNGAQQSVGRSLFARRRFRAFPLMRWEARMNGAQQSVRRSLFARRRFVLSTHAPDGAHECVKQSISWEKGARCDRRLRSGPGLLLG